MEENFKQINKDIIRVVLFGPESCGKTTMGESLAEIYNTQLVKENLRYYFENLKKEGRNCEKEDIIKIAEGQMKMENQICIKENKIVICDTDLLQISVYSRHYYDGYCPDILDKYTYINNYDIYLLMGVDIPWKPDGIRDMPHGREYMFELFENTLKSRGKNYVIIKGDRENRLNIAIKNIDKLLAK